VKKILLFAVVSVLIVSISVTSISAQSQTDIPIWVKGVAIDSKDQAYVSYEVINQPNRF